MQNQPRWPVAEVLEEEEAGRGEKEKRGKRKGKKKEINGVADGDSFAPTPNFAKTMRAKICSLVHRPAILLHASSSALAGHTQGEDSTASLEAELREIPRSCFFIA